MFYVLQAIHHSAQSGYFAEKKLNLEGIHVIF